MVWKYMREHTLPCGDVIKYAHVADSHAAHERAVRHCHISVHIHGHAEMGEADESGQQKNRNAEREDDVSSFLLRVIHYVKYTKN